MDIPIVSFIGWSGSGKTTFIEKLIPVFLGRGLRVAVLKSDGHEFQMDREGKDTFRFTSAGAELVAIANSRRAAVLENRAISFERLLSHIGDVDIILAEGWYTQPLPRIEVFRGHDTLRCDDPENLMAVITDREINPGVPVFGLEDIIPVADFILGRLSDCTLPAESYGRVRVMVNGSPAHVTPRLLELLSRASPEIGALLAGDGDEKEICITVK